MFLVSATVGVALVELTPPATSSKVQAGQCQPLGASIWRILALVGHGAGSASTLDHEPGGPNSVSTPKSGL